MLILDLSGRLRRLWKLWRLGGSIEYHVDVLAQVAHGVIVVFALTVDGCRARGPSLCLLLRFLGRDLLCREESSAWPTGPTHRMFMA